jgi:hypothetical protein
MCFNNCLLGKHDAMGYVSTCCGLGWVRHDVKEEGEKERREGRSGQKKTVISLMRALSLSALCVMDVLYM